MKFVLLAVVVLLAGVTVAHASDEAVAAKLAGKYANLLCTKCQTKQNELELKFKTFSTFSVERCIKQESERCTYGLNATMDALCPQAVESMCEDASNGVVGLTTCGELGVCDGAGVGSVDVAPQVASIWGECGACQDLVGEGIKETESFLCHGLSSALSAVCYAGAPICEAVLDDGCNDLVHYLCDTSCMATWVCHGFHACNSGPSSSCCR